MKRDRRTRNLAIEPLEDRHLLSVSGLPAGSQSFDPSPFEQEMLEHINRFRLAPLAELSVLFVDVEMAIARDPDAQIAMGVFQDPTAAQIHADWARLSAVAPLAWNTSLYKAATDHNHLMVIYDEQSHLLPGEPSLGSRLAAAGYQGSAVGENVFAYMNTVFHGHSAFAIDWGVANRSHRDNLMAPIFREIGISVVAESNAHTQVGPLLVTQDFGDGSALQEAYLLGVVYHDANGNGWYDAEEGFGGVELVIEGTGGSFFTSSMTAGGYQLLVPPGVYDITAYGGELLSPMTIRDVQVGSANVKVDFLYDPASHMPPLVDLNGPGGSGVDYQTTWFGGLGGVPIVAADAVVESPVKDRPILTLVAQITNHVDAQDFLTVDTTGTTILADYDAPAGILTLSGSASADEYQSVLRTLAYHHAGSNPDLTPRQIEVVAFDGARSSSPAVATVEIVVATLPEISIDNIRLEESPHGSPGHGFTVKLSAAVAWTVAVDFETRSATAVAGQDYLPVNRRLVFAPGETSKNIAITVIDDDLPEEDETFYGVLLNPSGASIARGVGVATIVDDDAAEKLGAVDFRGIAAIDVSAGSVLYQFSTWRDGVLSIDALAGADEELLLRLHDRFRNPLTVVSVFSVVGHARLDLRGVSPGETYYLEVSGTAEDARILLGNVVREEQGAVFVEGTDEDDAFEFTAGQRLWFAINGLDYEYSRDLVSTVAFSGGVGQDRAYLTGSPGDDTAELAPGRGSLSGAGYGVTVTETEIIHIAGGGGENDTASLFDSAGDDLLLGGPAATTLSGEGFANTVTGFPVVHAYSAHGGSDIARLIGGEDEEEFVGKADIGKLVGPDYFLRVKRFREVTVVGGGGVDSARIYGNSAGALFVAEPRFGELIGQSFHYVIEDFPYIHGYSRGGSADRATLNGSEGDDKLTATPVYARLVGGDYVVRAKFFPGVSIVALEGVFNLARLYDSEGDDTLILDVQETRITGRGFDHRLTGFHHVTAYSDAGGVDSASFYDTAGDDTFVGRPEFATLDGEGFFARAIGFDAVYAYAVAGGRNTAVFHSSPGDDSLLSRPDFTWLNGDGFFLRAKFFDVVHAYSASGGRDTARFYANSAPAHFVGQSTVSTITEGGGERRAQAFAEVYAEAGTGGGIAELLGSGLASDLLELGEGWARVSNTFPDFLIEARGFYVDPSVPDASSPPDPEAE